MNDSLQCAFGIRPTAELAKQRKLILSSVWALMLVVDKPLGRVVKVDPGSTDFDFSAMSYSVTSRYNVMNCFQTLLSLSTCAATAGRRLRGCTHRRLRRHRLARGLLKTTTVITTSVESPPHPPCVCMSIHPRDHSSSDLGSGRSLAPMLFRVILIDGPSARASNVTAKRRHAPVAGARTGGGAREDEECWVVHSTPQYARDNKCPQESIPAGKAKEGSDR